MKKEDMLLFFRKYKVLLKLFLVCSILIFIFSRVDIHLLIETIRSINLGLYLLAMSVLLLSKIVVSLQLKLVLLSVNVKRRLKELLIINFSASFYSFAGDLFGGVVRFNRISGKDNRRGESLFSILIQRYQLLLALYFSFLIGFFYSGITVLTSRELVVIIGFGLTSAVLFLIFLIVLFNQSGVNFSERLLTFFRRFTDSGFFLNKVEDLIRVMKVFRMNFLIFIKSFIVGFINQIIGFFAAWLVVVSLGIEIPFFAVIWVFSLTALAHLLPISFYGLGIREGMLIWLLGKYGVAVEASLLVGFLLFFIMIVHGVVGGLVELLSPFANREKIV
ncbi:MAG: lysylphosphatidylglycerol synthase transmembrane domain-containing protein [Candidatus Omnitrophica bacterium]|nr:lysylphosphatidylglycerol synthase transmembrane domain-containing protein [Candidatus Omnitrophota bacterium]